MGEILIVWRFDDLCYIPGESLQLAIKIAGELGQSVNWHEAGSTLYLNSPFVGQQVTIIVEGNRTGGARELALSLKELLAAASAKVTLMNAPSPGKKVFFAGPLLIWITDAPPSSPLVLSPGQYYGSMRLASLLAEEMVSATRFTPKTSVLTTDIARGPLPKNIPCVLVECPYGPPEAVKYWASGLRQGLSRYFSGEGTAFYNASTNYTDGKDTHELMQLFWYNLKQRTPMARLCPKADTLLHPGKSKADPQTLASQTNFWAGANNLPPPPPNMLRPIYPESIFGKTLPFPGPFIPEPNGKGTLFPGPPALNLPSQPAPQSFQQNFFAPAPVPRSKENCQASPIP